jgi:tellurite methyltransferase
MATYDKHYKKADYFGESYPELVFFFHKYEPKGHVLDLGCGQGRDAIALARIGYSVTGVDISKVGISQMLSIAQEEKLDVSGHVSDMYEFPIDDSYDIILLDSMLHFYPRDLEKETRFLEKLMADLKKSGLLCVVVWKSEKIENVLESILEEKPEWSSLMDRCVRYPEGKMDMRMIVLRKDSNPLQGS